MFARILDSSSTISLRKEVERLCTNLNWSLDRKELTGIVSVTNCAEQRRCGAH